MAEWISGRNPVYETLQAKRRESFQLILAENVKENRRIEEILAICSRQKIEINRVPRQKLDSIAKNHQGVALRVSNYPYCDLAQIFIHSAEAESTPILLVLDSLQDPQNFGTLLRTAEVVGVSGVVIPLRRTATITPAVVHASSGATEHLLIAQYNLAQAITLLKREGFWVLGLDLAQDAIRIDQVDLSVPLVLVVGSEGSGIRPLIRRSCDMLVKLPVRGKIDSLNASVAGSIALYLTKQARNIS